MLPIAAVLAGVRGEPDGGGGGGEEQVVAAALAGQSAAHGRPVERSVRTRARAPRSPLPETRAAPTARAAPPARPARDART